MLSLNVLLRYITIGCLLIETVNEDGEEEVQQDKVSDEDPRNVVSGTYSLEDH